MLAPAENLPTERVVAAAPTAEAIGAGRWSEEDLLALWSAAVDQTDVTRAVTMAAAAAPHVDPDELWDVPLGVRDALVVQLHRAAFGGRLDCLADCPACGEQLDVSLTVDDLVHGDGPPLTECITPTGTARFRAITSADVYHVDLRAADAGRRLAQSCLLSGDGSVGPSVAATIDAGPGDGVAAPDEALLDLVAAHLGDADPMADLTVELTCAACGGVWQAPCDIAAHVWSEIDVAARRLLLDVHALAGAYGWSEADVLAVAPTRRRFYLNVAGA